MEHHQQSSSSPLDLMPPLVGERICTSLPLGDLLTLRQLSRRTKGWVESPQILPRLCIPLRLSSHVDKMVYLAKKKGHNNKGLSVLFTNFKMSLEKLGVQAQIGKDFARIYGPQMKILDISSTQGYDKKISLVMECRMLQILRLKDLSLASLQQPEDLSEFGKVIQNLKELEISELDNADGRQVDALMEWVLNSRTLRTFTIPKIQLELAYLRLLPANKNDEGLVRRFQDIRIPREGPDPEEDLEENEDWELDPLEVELEAFKARDRKKTLEFVVSHILIPLTKGISQGKCPSLKSLDLQYIYPLANYPGCFLHEFVQGLMVACYQRGIFMMNLNVLFLKHCTIRVRDQFEKSLGAVGSLKNIAFFLTEDGDLKGRGNLAEGLVDLTSLKNLQVLESVVYPPVFFTQGGDYPLPLSSLTSLTLTIHFVPRLKKGIFSGEGGTYPSLNRLDIRVPYDSGDIASLAHVGKIFPNLKVLHLNRCYQPPEDFQEMFNHLENLEELEIKECKSLDDSVFIGKDPDPSTFKGLKNLRKLTLRVNEGDVTNLSLKEAFALLPLNKLSITFFGKSSISFQGLKALDQPPFRSSIQYLTLELQEDDIPLRKIRTVTDRLKGLKKFGIR